MCMFILLSDWLVQMLDKQKGKKMRSFIIRKSILCLIPSSYRIVCYYSKHSYTNIISNLPFCLRDAIHETLYPCPVSNYRKENKESHYLVYLWMTDFSTFFSLAWKSVHSIFSNWYLFRKQGLNLSDFVYLKLILIVICI